MCPDLRISHKMSVEEAKKINKILVQHGYSLGEILTDFSILELDIQLAGKYAYYSEIGEAEKNYTLKRELEEKRDKILSLRK